MSATGISPFQILAAINAYPRTFHVTPSEQIDGVLTGLSQKQGDIWSLLQTG